MDDLKFIKKIVHLSTVHRRTDVRIFYKECCSLSERYKSVEFLVLDGLGNACINGVNVVDMGSPPKSRIVRMIYGMYKALSSEVIKKADIVHFHDPELLIVGFLLKKAGKKVIYDAHEDVPRQIENKHWLPPIVRGFVSYLVEMIENFVVHRIDAVICTTELIKDRFTKINQRAIAVKNYPILGEFLSIPLLKPVSRDVCYIGAITRERGIVELLDALNRIKDVNLIICGPFESVEFEEELKRHPGWVFVKYLGILDRRGVARVLSTSRIGLVTLLPTSNQIESLPIKLFEYMASGTPFLASNFPLWTLIANQSGAGFCVDPLDSCSIAEKIEKMLSNQDALMVMGAAGRNAVIQNYNWNSESVKLINIYENIFDNEKLNIEESYLDD